MAFEEISSLQNVRVKQIVRWRDRGSRDKDQVVLIEGYRALTRALAADYPIQELYFCPEMYQGENENELLGQCAQRGARLFRLAPQAFGKIAYRDRPEGLLGIGPQKRRGLQDLPAPGTKAFYLVAEGIEKPGNLGTMMRSADAVQVDALILCDSRTDLYNPNVVRASTGNLFTLPIAEASSAEAVAWLKKGGVSICAASPHAERLYFDVDMTGPVAVVVGSEQYGLSQKLLQAADECLRLPMLGEADSLNVSTASALLLYECLRQRMMRQGLRDANLH
ncbi:MAG: RNA methyltransferase [Oligosphaeraceae bacterium]|nr:RNA methyltransferase [Oligosphaeraceae bacterium]